jgi:hypothetical protein
MILGALAALARSGASKALSFPRKRVTLIACSASLLYIFHHEPLLAESEAAMKENPGSSESAASSNTSDTCTCSCSGVGAGHCRRHAGGLGAAVLAVEVLDAAKAVGLLTLSGDFQLVKGLYLSIAFTVGISYTKKVDSREYDEWLYPIWATLGAKYFWFMKRFYIYPGILFSFGYLTGHVHRRENVWFDEEEIMFYKDWLVGGELLFGLGIRLSHKLSFYMEPKALIAGAILKNAVIVGGGMAFGIRAGL